MYILKQTFAFPVFVFTFKIFTQILAALYTQQASVNQADNTSSAIYTSGKASNWNFKKAIKSGKLKSAPKVQQLHYCEVFN